jgi:hypothetical protein
MQKYVPLSQRSPEQIRTQAELYQEMAATARTPDAKRGLEALAARFAALADQRETAENGPRRSQPVQDMVSTAD